MLKSLGIFAPGSEYHARPVQDGGFIVLHYIKDTTGSNANCPNGGTVSATVTRFDAQGIVIWSRDYGNADVRAFNATNQGESIFVCNSEVIKLANDGKLIRSIPIQGNIWSLEIDKKGNYYLLAWLANPFSYQGVVQDQTNSTSSFYLAKIDSKDSVKWCKPAPNATSQFKLDNAGEFVISSANEVIKYDSHFNFLWKKAIPVQEIRTDRLANIYLLGSFCDTLKIDNQNLIEIEPNPSFCGDQFVCKLWPTGQVAWITQIGSRGIQDQVYSFDVTPDGYAFWYGEMIQTVHVASDSVSRFPIINWLGWTQYFARIGQSGELTWSARLHGEVFPVRICASYTEDAFFLGKYISMSVEGFSLTSCGAPNYFMFKKEFTSEVAGLNDQNNGNTISIYPNPSDGQITIDGLDRTFAISYQIFNSEGEVVKRDKLTSPQLNLDLTEGLYFLELIAADKHMFGKFLVIK
jgi:hypothetical protein